MGNFVTSITLQFRDAFSSGFADARNSMAGMKDALGGINKNKDMFDLAGDLSLMSGRFDQLSGKISSMIEQPSQLAGTFDSSMRNIQSLTNESNESLAGLSKELLAIGGNAVAGPNAIADAYYNIASGIGNAEVRMDTLRSAVALAEAGQADLGAATSGLISVVNAYNVPAEGMTGVSDIFFQTVRKGVGSLDGFVSAMSSISGLSASVGIGFDELGSSMAFLTAKGQTESVAATQLKAAMVSLMRPNAELQAALESIGISSGSAMLEQYGLAASLDLVKQALGGSQDKMAKALGSVEALQAAINLTADDYTGFARSYAGGLSNATADALTAQTQSYEAKVAKLEAASDALKIQMGDDINAIKGFFVDMKASFLSGPVNAIMSSPIGGAFQRITALAGIAAQGVLGMGSGVLNTATQLVTLTSTLSSAGGFTKLFGSTLGMLKNALTGVGKSVLNLIAPLWTKVAATFTATAAESGYAAAMWAGAAATWAALWPILAVIAAVALVVGGAYLLIKNWSKVTAFFVNLWNKITGAFSAAWNWIKNLLSGASNWVLGAVAVFLPFVGIPALIIKNWTWIKAFFASLAGSISGAIRPVIDWLIGVWDKAVSVFKTVWSSITSFFASLWNGITGIVTNIANWLSGVWNSVVSAFTIAWGYISEFFISLWNGIVSVVTTVANWFGAVWSNVTGTFAAAWTWIKDLFTSVWESIKGVVLGFVEWLSPVIDTIIAPFKAIGNAIGGIVNKVGGVFGKAKVDADAAVAMESAAQKITGKTPASVAQPPAAEASAPARAAIETPSLAAPAAAVETPSLAAPAAIAQPPATGAISLPQNTISGTTAAASSGGGSALLAEHMAQASRKGFAASAVSTAASDAFAAAGKAPAVAGAALPAFEDMTEKERLDFPEAMPKSSPAPEVPWNRKEERQEKKERPSFNIQNLTLQSDDFKNMYDFYCQLEMIFSRPEAVAV